jgi:hypothetical protein
LSSSDAATTVLEGGEEGVAASHRVISGKTRRSRR